MEERMNIYFYKDEETGLYSVNINDNYFLEELSEEEINALTILDIKDLYQQAKEEWEDYI